MNDRTHWDSEWESGCLSRLGGKLLNLNPNRGLLLIQEILLGMECAKITGKGKWALTVSWDLSRSCEMLAAVKLLVDNGL